MGIIEGSIAHLLALIHTPYIIITKFIAIASSCQLSKLSSLVHSSLLLTPLNFLCFSTQLSLKILAKQSKLPKKYFHFTVELFNLAKARDFPSDVMFSCQGKLGEFMPASKLASTFVLASVFMPLKWQLFSTPTFMKILAHKR